LGVVFRAFLAGAAVVICESKDIIEAILEDHVTHISLVPAQLYRLLETAEGVEALKKLKVILLGGSAAAESLLRRAVSHHLPVYVTYGLTEMSSQVATSRCLRNGDLSLKAQILNGREVRIAPDGEVMVKGKTLFKGYVFGKGIDPSVDQNGWFPTGDLGRLHEDGTLSITGRKDRMFISGGENIQPEEIERCLCQMESIAQAVVVGIAHAEFGCRPVAFVSSTDGTRITRAEILDHLRHHLPKFKIPDQIYHWPKDVDEKGIKVDRRYFAQLAAQSATNLIPVN
jgi:O-succinylbenzoic acid--CoA ligase